MQGSRASNIVNPNAYDKIDTYLRSVRTWTIDCLTTWLTRCLYSMMTTGLPEGPGYMKSLYPAAAKRLIPYIEEECDRLEYEGSMMYDEYPDQLQLRLMCRRIYDQVAQEEENPGEWLKDLIQVMAYQELCNRRSEYRNFKRKFY